FVPSFHKQRLIVFARTIKERLNFYSILFHLLNKFVECRFFNICLLHRTRCCNITFFPFVISIHKPICDLYFRAAEGFALLLCCINSLTLAFSYSIPFLLCHPREDLQDKVCYEGSHTVFILSSIK